MRTVMMIVSLGALLWLIAAAILFFTDVLTLPQAKQHLLLATVAWFVATPLWINRTRGETGKPEVSAE